MRVFRNADDIAAAVGTDLGFSQWLEITQDRVNMFADATGDHQWIHIDVARAERESPFGGPIAHGYLSLSLIPVLAAQIYRIEGAKLLVNYGSNKVRFIAPVPVGSRVRLNSTIASVTPAGTSGLQVVVTSVMDIDGNEKPALSAETVTRVIY